jgi:hypothetical protein
METRYSGVWQSLRLAGVWSQALGFLFVWHESDFSRREDLFTLNLLYKEIL